MRAPQTCTRRETPLAGKKYLDVQVNALRLRTIYRNLPKISIRLGVPYPPSIRGALTVARKSDLRGVLRDRLLPFRRVLFAPAGRDFSLAPLDRSHDRSAREMEPVPVMAEKVFLSAVRDP